MYSLGLLALVAYAATTPVTDRRALVSALIQDSSSLQSVIKHHDIPLDEALERGTVPKDIALMAKAEKKQKAKGEFSEESLSKARGILNGMIESSQAELDAKIIECKEFHDKNRGTWEQVRTDLSRLGEQIADMNRLKADAINGIGMTDDELKAVEELQDNEHIAYTNIRTADDAEMLRRKNDLAVAEFIMNITKCQGEAAGLLQKKMKHTVLSCSGRHTPVFKFTDAEIQRKVDSLKSPKAKLAIQNALGLAVQNRRVHGDFSSRSLLQVEEHEEYEYEMEEEDPDEAEASAEMEEEDVDTTATELTETGKPKKKKKNKKKGKGLLKKVGKAIAGIFKKKPPPPTVPPPTDAPITEPAPGPQAKKCSIGKPNCGLLHDNMSLMWGEMKDAVDSLQAKMDEEEAEFKALNANFNAQIQVLTSTKGNLQSQLAEATAGINADTEEQAKKQQEEIELEQIFKEVWGECESKIDEILFTNICGVRKVRGEVQKHSEEIKPTDLIDCEVSDFIPQQCSVECDDQQIGGVQHLLRSVIQANNEHGTVCPQLDYISKCNQIKCPVNCLQSSFTGWSKCTKECEGGIQTRSRNILSVPKNGGSSCDVPSEQRACNTGSCDRDCKLEEWTKYTPCSQACGTGFAERFRHMRKPTRGNGKCPKAMSRGRYRKKHCNQQLCMGDEECIAKIDVVLAIDGSGSLREEGWETLKNFTGEVVKKFRGRAYENGAMKVGIVQFGNGEVMEDGTISPAELVLGLTDEMDVVKSTLSELTWKKGFTNMAQAFTMSKTVFLNGGRKSAQSQVLVITDAQPSFKFQTKKIARDLVDTGVHLNFVAIRPFPGPEMEYIRSIASQPHETHVTFIPGLKKLKQDTEVFAMETLVQNCPRAESPSQVHVASAALGYELVAENRDCPCWWLDLGKHQSVEGCKEAALAHGAKNFVFGVGAVSYYGGQCFSDEKSEECSCGWTDSTFEHYKLIEDNKGGDDEGGEGDSLFLHVSTKELHPVNVNKRPPMNEGGERLVKV